MKKIMILLMVIISFSVGAKEKVSEESKLESCEAILAAGMFNGVLEEVCGFNGGLKNTMLRIYDQSGCRKIVSQETVNEYSEKVIEDSKMRFQVFGEKKFCEDNMKPYYDLMQVK